MSTKEKRIVFVSKGVVEFEEFDLEEPQDNEVLVASKAQLLNAGTELANLNGITIVLQTGEASYPIRPGGSNAGEVIQVGKGVTRFKVGDRVLGAGRHSARAVFRENDVDLIPDGVSYEEASFGSLCAVGMQGVRVAQPELGDVVVVIGAGIIGALAMQFAKICGARDVVAVDLSEGRLKMARDLGIEHTLNPAETDVIEAVKELTDGEMADIVIEATGSPKTFQTAFRLARARGRVVALGSPRGWAQDLDLYTELHCKGLQLIGAHNGTHPRVETPYNKWTRERDSRLAIELIRQKRLPAAKMITHRFPIERATEGYHMLQEDRTRALAVVFTG